MEIRLAKPDEAEALWHVRNAAIRHGCKGVYAAEIIDAWTPDAMPEGHRKMIEDNPFYVAVTPEGQPVATGFLDLESGSIEAIFTLPEWGGQGLAARIIRVLKQEAIARGFTQLTLASTPNACGFYQKQGFTIVRESFYPSKLARAKLRCVNMVCELTQGE